MDAAAAAGLAWLALSGCTTSTDHHYVFPRDGGDLLGAEIDAAAGSACASTRPAARWTSASRQGGLPPDEVVEDSTRSSPRAEDAIARFHDPSPGAMLRVARRALLAVLGHRASCCASRPRWPGRAACGCTPTSPRRSTRRSYCREHFGCTPVEYMERLGWLGPDVWLAHGVHLDDAGDRAGSAATGTGVAHCPSSNAPARRRHRPGPGAARRRRPGRARRGRRRVAGGRPARRGAAPGAAARTALAAVRGR